MEQTLYTNHTIIDLKRYWAAQSAEDYAAAVRPVTKPAPKAARPYDVNKKSHQQRLLTEQDIADIIAAYPDTVANAARKLGRTQKTIKKIWDGQGFAKTTNKGRRPAY